MPSNNALPLNVLLICNRPVRNADASTITDHLDAFQQHSGHRVQELSFLGELPVSLDLAQFDVLVIHYSIAIGYLSEHYISAASKARVRDFPGLKVVFIQDEYRAINAVHEMLRMMKVDLLFTCMPDGEIEKVYPESTLPGLAKVNTLTGYVPDRLLAFRVARIADRSIDVGYRTRKPPFWLGRLGYEKWQIAERFVEKASAAGLRLDISYREEDRFYGDAWIRFVGNCRAMLGVESGSSVFDFDGNLQRDVDAYVASHPNESFEEVHAKFLVPHEGAITQNQISPRCFEAAAMRTAMVLYEGGYSGVLTPWQHYIPLRKDFGNIADVIAALRDVAGLQKMVDRTFSEIASSGAWSYRSFVSRFDAAVADEFEKRGKQRAAAPYTRGRYLGQLAVSPAYLIHRMYSRAFQWLLLATPLRRIMFNVWGRVPLSARQLIRPLLRLIGR